MGSCVHLAPTVRPPAGRVRCLSRCLAAKKPARPKWNGRRPAEEEPASKQRARRMRRARAQIAFTRASERASKQARARSQRVGRWAELAAPIAQWPRLPFDVHVRWQRRRRRSRRQLGRWRASRQPSGPPAGRQASGCLFGPAVCPWRACSWRRRRRARDEQFGSAYLVARISCRPAGGPNSIRPLRTCGQRASGRASAA